MDTMADMDSLLGRPDLLAVRDAAAQLGVSTQRVRALVANGDLDAYRVGSTLLLSADSVARRISDSPSGGRPWSPVMAWAVLGWLDHDAAALSALDSRDRWRLRKRLAAADGLDAIASRLARRAVVGRYFGHSSIPARIRREGVPSAVSAASAYDLDLVDDGSVADVYLPERAAVVLQRQYRLTPASGEHANVIVRAVSDQAWTLEGRAAAPRAAVALDLLESGDSRSRAAAHALADRIWREVPR